MAEEPRHCLRVWRLLDGNEGAVPPEQAPRDEKMHMGMPIQEIAGALQAHDGTRDRPARSRRSLEQLLERLVGQASEFGQSLPASEERPQAPREREDRVAVRDKFQDLFRDELAEGRLPLRVARGAEAALLTREGEHYGLHLFSPS